MEKTENNFGISSVKRETSLLILSSIFTASLVLANLIGSRLVTIADITVSSAIFVFPFTFIAVDIITELYGKTVAIKVVRIGIFLQLYVLFFIQLVRLLPTSKFYDISESYEKIFSLTPRMIIASIIAYSVALTVNVFVFSRLKDKFSGKFLFLRTNITFWITQLVDTFIFIGIFLGGVLPIVELLKTILTAYIAKMIVATCDGPFVNLGVYLLQKRGKRHDSKN